MFLTSSACVVCGQDTINSDHYFCGEHNGKYIYNFKYDIIHLRAYRRVSKLQRKLFVIIRDIFRENTFQEVIFEWAGKPSGAYYRFDVVVPSKKLIVEMDGQQHFKFVKLFHTNRKKFESEKQKDKDKELLAMTNGWKVIRFSYKTKLTKENIKNMLDLKMSRE